MGGLPGNRSLFRARKNFRDGLSCCVKDELGTGLGIPIYDSVVEIASVEEVSWLNRIQPVLLSDHFGGGAFIEFGRRGSC